MYAQIAQNIEKQIKERRLVPGQKLPPEVTLITALEVSPMTVRQALAQLVEKGLPAYAQPVFIRLLQTAETTVTFKLLKGDLREQAFHLDKVGEDRIYVRKPRSNRYEPLDQAFYQQLIAGKAGY